MKHIPLIIILVAGLGVAMIARSGIPMRDLPLPQGFLIGAVNGFAVDSSRADLFSGKDQRIVPFQILYPARAPGSHALYVPDADPLIDATVKSRGWISRVFLGQIGALSAPWTNDAAPSDRGPFPVVLYLPGVTGYMQMGSFQTSGLAAQGYVVVTLNQPGVVAAALMPDGQIIRGLTSAQATSLVAPSYRQGDSPQPEGFAAALMPQHSIVPYFAQDVMPVLDRLAEINADPAHILHGVLDLEHVGVMGMSLGAIVGAQACAMEVRIGACLMMDAPVPTEVASAGLRQPALWISRPKDDQRRERDASGGWPEEEIDAQTDTIDQAIANSGHSRLVMVHGFFHVDFTDLPAVQPVFGWLGQSGPTGIIEAHRQVNALTLQFFATAFRRGGE